MAGRDFRYPIALDSQGKRLQTGSFDKTPRVWGHVAPPARRIRQVWAAMSVGSPIRETMMNRQKLAALKPAVSRSTHLFVAPLLWTVIGAMLMIRGWGWIGSGKARWLVLVALGIGTAKSSLVLDKTAKRGVERIIERGDGTCLGGVYSWKTWLFVGLMMALGISMRTLTEPGVIIGTIYMAIGWALFYSSRHPWVEWLKYRKG